MTDEHERIEPPWRAFVTVGTRTAKVATVRTDGRPHIAPIAFVLDGDDLVFVTALDSVKGRTLRRTGIASATVDEETPPYPFVIVEGTVTTTEQPAELRRFASAIALRYVGAENVEEFTERNAVPGQILVRLTPHRVIARLNGHPRQTLTYTGSQRSAAITPGSPAAQRPWMRCAPTYVRNPAQHLYERKGFQVVGQGRGPLGLAMHKDLRSHR